ncbi:MAG: hypothetical protein KKE11_05080 [Gammaproteobacteria bacterium]|nr:hypothetical protein [Gammaproteobacteria bacterium]
MKVYLGCLVNKSLVILVIAVFSLLSPCSFADNGVEDLREAIRKNNAEEVKHLLGEGVDSNKSHGFLEMPSCDISKLLLDNDKNPMNPSTFLEFVSSPALIEVYDSVTKTFKVDDKLSERQLELARWVIEEKGADPNTIYLSALPSMELSKLLLDNNKITMHPDYFLKIILGANVKRTDFETGHKKFDDELLSKQLNLAKWAIEEKGASLNDSLIYIAANSHLHVFGNDLIDSLNHELLKLLFDQAIDPGLFCKYLRVYGNAYYKENGIESFAHDGYLTLEQAYKNLNVKKSSEPRVPRIVNYVWLTNDVQRRELFSEDIANVIKTKKFFAQSGKEWQHIVWTNDKTLIPKSVEKLEAEGILVREMSEVQGELQLYDEVMNLIEQAKWGMAADALKYDVTYYLGGVCVDVDYCFMQNIEDIIYRYDFYIANSDTNNFFIAKPKHAVLNEALRLVKRNLNNPPEHVTLFKNKDVRDKTYRTTVIPFHDAYYRFANSNGTVDIRYPSKSGSSDNFAYNGKIDPSSFKEKDMGMGVFLKQYLPCEEDLDFFAKVLDRIKFVKQHDVFVAPESMIGTDIDSSTYQSWVD